MVGPLLGDHDVPDVQRRVDPSGHAGEQHRGDGESLQRELQLVGGVDEAHAGAEDDHFMTTGAAAPEGESLDPRFREPALRFHAELAAERRQLWRISGAEREQGRAVRFRRWQDRDQ